MVRVSQLGSGVPRRLCAYEIAHVRSWELARRFRAFRAFQPDTIEEVVEPYLIQEGLLMRTPRGRALAEGAYQHLGLQAPKNINQLELIATDRSLYDLYKSVCP